MKTLENILEEFDKEFSKQYFFTDGQQISGTYLSCKVNRVHESITKAYSLGREEEQARVVGIVTDFIKTIEEAYENQPIVRFSMKSNLTELLSTIKQK